MIRHWVFYNNSGVMERSVGVEYRSGVESDFRVANAGYSFAPKHNNT